jgi:hypothetical protein
MAAELAAEIVILYEHHSVLLGKVGVVGLAEDAGHVRGPRTRFNPGFGLG